MKVSEITKITGERYNIFGKNLTRWEPTKEEETIMSEQIKKNNLSADELTTEDMLEVAKDIIKQKESLLYIEKQYQSSQTHCALSFIMLALTVLMGFWYVSLLFFVSALIFSCRTYNFKLDYHFRSGFLSFALWFQSEIGPTVYNVSHSPMLPFVFDKDEANVFKEGKKNEK